MSTTERFARNSVDSGLYKRLLKKHKVEVIIVRENLSSFSTDPGQFLLSTTMENFSEYFSINLGLEVKRGQIQAIERGFHPSGKAPIGYMAVKIDTGGNRFHSKLEIDPEKGPAIEKLFHMAADGKYMGELLSHMNNSIPPPRSDIWDINTIRWI